MLTFVLFFCSLTLIKLVIGRGHPNEFVPGGSEAGSKEDVKVLIYLFIDTMLCEQKFFLLCILSKVCQDFCLLCSV
jgi:hypothetical protein